MAAAIIIQVKLGTDDIDRAGKEIASKLSNALAVGVKAAREAGKKIGEALGGGIESGARYTSREERERAHARRIEAINAQSAARLQEIEAKKQAQFDVIRERATQREIEQLRKLERAAQSGSGGFQAFLRRYSSTIREAGESIQQAGYGALGLTTAIFGVGTAAVRSAIEIDKQVNALKALTGSAEAAEKRFAKLVEISQKTPGLTASLATTLDAQLRVANVTEQTINRILPAIGRLNAISPVGDASEFARNLAQIGQSFDKTDIKQLVERSAFSGELLKQLFNVDSATNAEAIRESAKKLGIKTVDEFVSAFAQVAENNPKLARVTESLGTQLEKLQDRITVALRPLGVKLLEVIVPAVESLVPIVEKVFNVFNQLPSVIQTAIITFGVLAASIGPVIIGLGGLIQFAGSIGNLITVVTALNTTFAATTVGTAGLSVATGGLLATLTPLLITFGAVAAAVGVAVVAYKFFSSSNDDATKTIVSNIKASKQQITTSQQQIDQLQNLASKAKLSNDEQKRVEEVYSSLTPLQRERVKLFAAEGGGIDTVSGKLPALIELLKGENAERRKKAQQDAIESGKKIANDTRLAVSAYLSLTEQSKKLNKELEVNSKKLLEAEKSGKGFANAMLGFATPAAEGFLKENEKLTAQLNRANAQKEKAQKNLEKLTGAHLEGAQAAGLSTEEYLRQAFSIYKNGIQGKELSTVLGIVAEKQKTVAQTTETATEKFAKLNEEFRKFLEKKDFKGIEDGLNKQIREIASNAPNTKEALRQLNQLRQEADNIDKSIKDQQRIGKNLEALQKEVEGKPQVSASQTRRAERDAFSFDKAREKFQQEARENQLRLDKDVFDRSLKNQEYFYSQGLKTATEFHAQKQALQQQGVNREIALLDIQIAEETARLVKYKANSRERIEIEAQIEKVKTDRVLKERELGDIETNIAREVAAAKKAYENAQINFAREAREATYQLDKDLFDRTLDEYQRLYDTSVLSADEYFKKKLELHQKAIQGEIDLNAEEIRDLQKNLEKYKEGTEKRLEIQGQINRLTAEGILLTREYTEAEKKLNRERNAPSTRLEEEIADIKRKSKELNNPELAAKRREKAQVEAEYEMAKASDDAANEIIKSRAKIADASIYHADRANAIFLDHLAKQQSVTEAVADSMIKAYEGVASSLDRGIDKMTKKLGAFGEFVNGIFKAIARNLLASLFNPQQQGSGQQSANGGILGVLSGIFNRGSGGGGGVGPGGTPVFNPGYFAGGNGSSQGSLFSGSFLNLTNSSMLNSVFSQSSASSGPTLRSVSTGKIVSGPGSTTGGFKGVTNALGPLVGMGLGQYAGGQSPFGQLLGGVGGALVGAGITGMLTGAAPLLFSNPVTAIIGGALLGASALIGLASGAKQRRKDEEASGDYLREADAAIHKLKDAINNDEVQGYAQAKEAFENQILANFRNQIGQLKTKSVRESRLTNQVRDLYGTFDAVIQPAVDEQLKRKEMSRQRQLLSGLLVPEFAVGGFVPGAVGSPQLILAHGGEMVVNPSQQTANLMHAAANAGVPGTQGGGTAKSEPQQPQTINVTLVLGTEIQNQLFVNGAKSNSGFRAIIQQIQNGLGFKDFRLEGI